MKSKALLISISVIILAVLAWLFWPKNASVKELYTSIKQRVFVHPASFPLKNGRKGLEVLFFQVWLNLYNNESLVLDGWWGSKTEAAAKRAKYSSGISTNFGIEISESIYNIEVVPNLTEIKKHLDAKGIDYA